MQIVYWAHSYRKEDAAINRHFGILLETAGRMIANFDPPTESVNASKLLQNLRCCDGMAAFLTWRATGPSPYILFEIGLALQARKPVIVFVDDRLSSNILPARILQHRFAHNSYFRQVREHVHALNVFKAYMGNPPPTRYQPSTDQRSCGVVGLSLISRRTHDAIDRFVTARGYCVVDLESISSDNPFDFDQFEQLATISIVLHCLAPQSPPRNYWTGAVRAAALPLITITSNQEFALSDRFPIEFQPRICSPDSIHETLTREFDLFEQSFLSAESPDTIEKYVKMQIEAGALAGNYGPSTRQLFVGAIMGDQYNISGQIGAVGPNAVVHNATMSQAWNQFACKLDLPRLADELARLRTEMERKAKAPEEKLSTGAIAAAEQCVRQNEGSKAMGYLKTAGKWALTVAEKVGVELAKDALKASLRL